MTALQIDGANFSRFTLLYLDESGRFIDTSREESRAIDSDELAIFLKRAIPTTVLNEKTTDVFVWVHGWQNDELRAITTARKLFANLSEWFASKLSSYPGIETMVPAFVAVHWPSNSLPGPGGYRKIRDRAKAMTTKGEAEFFLASLLGYLDDQNERAPNRKVLKAKGGYYIHCLGHSFGGRFLTAAMTFAATPKERERKKLSAAYRQTGFPFNIDSLCVLQMAAGAQSFAGEFSSLLDDSPLCGPIVLTHSSADRALCTWHRAIEQEAGIGCNGASAPENRIGRLSLRSVATSYPGSDFAKDITNVDASHLFQNGGWAEGGHSDFWHEETLHLIASLVEQVRHSPRLA